MAIRVIYVHTHISGILEAGCRVRFNPSWDTILLPRARGFPDAADHQVLQKQSEHRRLLCLFFFFPFRTAGWVLPLPRRAARSRAGPRSLFSGETRDLIDDR